ncbi:hypothetical protein [Neptunicoccus sediminis]|uniref:hypothetical protein n=1 Tax=Neptunicoccus sediminis TaxID=1892596 RepID=UPI000845DDC2|nr:hypothetical protein [Neptunicoccus sediminis]
MTQVRRLTLLSLLGAVAPVVLLVVLTLIKTGGVWEYALDDVYIHLAMSEQVAKGAYGVNAGESASASSSILYSYVLAPFAGFHWHAYVPLAIGLLALFGAAVLWSRVLAASEIWTDPVWDKALLALALLGPVFLHFPAMSLIGMEHMLHICTALLVALGLIRFAQDGRVRWYLLAAIVLNPLLRFEGMALALLACAVLVVGGRGRIALLAILATALPLTAHFVNMNALGLDMLPNSVNAKAVVVGGGADVVDGAGSDRLVAFKNSLKLSLISPSGRMLVGLILCLFFLVLAQRNSFSRLQIALGVTAMLAALAHLLLGSVLPFYRYEIYIWAYGAAVTVYLLAQLQPLTPTGRQLRAIFPVVALVIGGVHYPVTTLEKLPTGSAAIHAQQRQMGRFVDDYWQAPVAVNDLGHVAYRNPHYVLDLWGLASARALEARTSRTDPLWADKLAQEYDVGAAMIYRHWLAHHIPPSWEPVARLKLTVPIGTLGGNIVTIYATRPESLKPLEDALRAFAPTLPASATLEFL